MTQAEKDSLLADQIEVIAFLNSMKASTARTNALNQARRVRDWIAAQPVSDPPPPPPPPSAVPTSWSKIQDYAQVAPVIGSGHGQWRVDAPMTLTHEAGQAKLVTNGAVQGGINANRMKFEDGFSLTTGADLWIGGDFTVLDPSKITPGTRFMNLTNYEQGPAGNWYLALECMTTGTWQVSFAPYADPHTVVLASRPIPANQKQAIDVHLKLSPTDGQALTEWYVNGGLVASSTKRNMLDSGPLHAYFAGLPYFAPGPNATVWLNRPRMKL